MRVIGMDGTVVADTTRAVTLPPLASTRVDDLADAALLRGADPHRTLAVFELIANGQTLSVSSNQALFALYGTTYGGNGATTFQLPNLTSVTPNGMTYYVCSVGVFPSSN